MRSLIVLAFLMSTTDASAQFVGIGTNTPTEKLDINGNLKVSGNLNINGSTGISGQVLISQGAASPVWTNLSKLTGIDYSFSNQSAQTSSELFSGDIVLKSASVADKWYDGVGLVSIGDTLYTFGGWFTSVSTGDYVINSIRYSVDDGSTWQVSPYVLPFSGHAFVYFKTPDGWLYILGADNAPSNVNNLQTVWRTKNMQTFSVMTTAAGWGTRSLMGGWADENANLYIAGGQKTNTVATGPNDIWKSSDNGVSWIKIADNINVNGEYFLGQNICNHIKYFNKRVYVIAGGISAAQPYDSYSKKVYSAPIDNLLNWRKEEDLPYTNGRRYASVEVWDNKLWFWSGHNSSEGNVRSISYMDKSGKWFIYKYNYTENNPTNLITTTHAAGIAVHKDMLYRVLGNFSNEAYAIRRSNYVSGLNIRDTLNVKTLVVTSLQGSGSRLAIADPTGELKPSSLLLTDILTTSTDITGMTIKNQITTAQQANLWITGRGIIGTGADRGKALQVNGESYTTGLTGLGTFNPSTYLAGVYGMSVYNATSAGISLANANKFWMYWINNNDLKFYEGGAGVNRFTLKAGGVVNIENLAGSGTRMVTADASGNLATQTIVQSSENITVSNLGNTQMGLFKQKIGSNLELKSLFADPDAGLQLVTTGTDIQLKNSGYSVYGASEFTTVNSDAVTMKTIIPSDYSAGTLEVDITGITNSLGIISGKKYIQYKKYGGLVSVISITDLTRNMASGNLSTADWQILPVGGNLVISVIGELSKTIKWKAVYKMNQITGP